MTAKIVRGWLANARAGLPAAPLAPQIVKNSAAIAAAYGVKSGSISAVARQLGINDFMSGWYVNLYLSDLMSILNRGGLGSMGGDKPDPDDKVAIVGTLHDSATHECMSNDETPDDALHSDPRKHHERATLRELQTDKLKAELSQLRAEEKNLAISYFRERLKLVYDFGLVIIVVAATVSVLGILVYSAAHSRSVVLNAFSVPSDFNAMGNTGVVVASNLLDRFQALQSATRAAAQRHKIEDAWSNDIKIEIPEAGISLGEFLQYLRNWIGNDIRVDGNIVEAGPNILLTVRGSGIQARSFSGNRNELPAMITQAAEYVYGQSEPYLFADYLESAGRDKEAINLVKQIYNAVGKDDRANLLTIWGNTLIDIGDVRGAIEKYRAEIGLNPQAWIAYANVISAQIALGDEEGALRTGMTMDDAFHQTGRSPDRNTIYYENIDVLRMDLRAAHNALIADMATNHGLGTEAGPDAPLDAEMLARMHDLRDAEIELQTSPGAESDSYVIAETAYVRGWAEMRMGRLQAAYRDISEADQLVSKSPYLANNFASPPSCLAGLLAELTGRAAIADADITRGGHFEDCYRFKAEIADHRANWSGAENIYRAAIALAPSMPAGYFSWGEALMGHHMFVAAAKMFAAAHAKGPRWADPLKRWGDALAAEGNIEAAVEKYQEAEQYAPRWGGLQIAWGRALDRLGQHNDALHKYRAALTMDLTGDEHWELRHCCG